MYVFGLLLAIAAVGFVLGVLVSENRWRKEMAADFTALNASIAKLQTDVAALVASHENVQPAIDAATQAVNAVDASVLAATPAPTPAP